MVRPDTDPRRPPCTDTSTLGTCVLSYPLRPSWCSVPQAPPEGRDSEPGAHPSHRVVLEGSGGGTLSLPGFEGDRVSFRLSASASSELPGT